MAQPGQSIEERVLLESRLERAHATWQLVTIDKTVPTCNHGSQWLTADVMNSAKKLEPREFPHADLLAKYKMVAAGGYVVSWLFEQHCGGLDLDIFVVGTDINEATARVWAFMRDLIARLMLTYRIVHSMYQIKIVFDTPADWRNFKYPLEYQFILRLYPSTAHILGGFDISACGVGHDGMGVHATKLAMWSLVNKSVLVDVTRSSPSFAQRIMKYHEEKRLDIIFVGVPADAYSQYTTAYEDVSTMDYDDLVALARLEQRTHEDEIYKAAHTTAIRRMEDLDVNGSCYVNARYKYPEPEISKYKQELMKIHNRFYIREKYAHFYIVLRLSKHFAYWPCKHNFSVILRNGNSARTHDYSHPMDAPYQPQGNTALLQRNRADLIAVWAWSRDIKDPAEILTIAPVFADTPTPAHEQACIRLRALEWITENPGRQWTASFDPRPLSGPTYYLNDADGKPLYRGRIHQTHITTLLWLGWKYDRGCVFAGVPRDMMNMITIYTLWELAEY